MIRKWQASTSQRTRARALSCNLHYILYWRIFNFALPLNFSPAKTFLTRNLLSRLGHGSAACSIMLTAGNPQWLNWVRDFQEEASEKGLTSAQAFQKVIPWFYIQVAVLAKTDERPTRYTGCAFIVEMSGQNDSSRSSA